MTVLNIKKNTDNNVQTEYISQEVRGGFDCFVSCFSQFVDSPDNFGGQLVSVVNKVYINVAEHGNSICTVISSFTGERALTELLEESFSCEIAEGLTKENVLLLSNLIKEFLPVSVLYGLEVTQF